MLEQVRSCAVVSYVRRILSPLFDDSGKLSAVVVLHEILRVVPSRWPTYLNVANSKVLAVDAVGSLATGDCR